jgi:hypothetical protein
LRGKKSRKRASRATGFESEVSDAVKDLFYISETDSEIFPFTGKEAESVSAEELLGQIGSRGPVEERDFEEFFDRLTKLQEWFGDEETRAANRFAELREILKKHLADLKVFKVGRIEVDIFIVGLDENGILRGVRTKAVET